MEGKQLGVTHIKKFADADDAELQAHDKHGQPAKDRRDDQAKPLEGETDQHFNDTGEQGHSEDEPHPAAFGRNYRGAEISCGKHRWRQEPRAGRSARQCCNAVPTASAMHAMPIKPTTSPTGGLAWRRMIATMIR